MTKFETKDTLLQHWLLLGEYIQQKLNEVLSPKLAARLVRQDLHRKQRNYRYLDINGNCHQDDLPDEFWLEAYLYFATSSAFRPVKKPDGNPYAFVVTPRPLSSPSGAPPIMCELPPLIPALEIFRIEVLAPYPDTAIRDSRTAGDKHQKLGGPGPKCKIVETVLCGLYPDGIPPNMRPVDLNKVVGDELEKRNLRVPSLRTILRAASRRK